MLKLAAGMLEHSPKPQMTAGARTAHLSPATPKARNYCSGMSLEFDFMPLVPSGIGGRLTAGDGVSVGVGVSTAGWSGMAAAGAGPVPE